MFFKWGFPSTKAWATRYSWTICPILWGKPFMPSLFIVRNTYLYESTLSINWVPPSRSSNSESDHSKGVLGASGRSSKYCLHLDLQRLSSIRVIAWMQNQLMCPEHKLMIWSIAPSLSISCENSDTTSDFGILLNWSARFAVDLEKR